MQVGARSSTFFAANDPMAYLSLPRPEPDDSSSAMYITSEERFTGNQDFVKLVVRAIREIVASSDQLVLKAERAHDLVNQEMRALSLGRRGSASIGHSAGGQRQGSAASDLEEE